MESPYKDKEGYPTKPGGTFYPSTTLPIDYMLWKPIGKGSFGIVWKSKILCGPRKDELVAIKIINLDDFRDKSVDEIRVIYCVLRAAVPKVEIERNQSHEHV